MGHTCIMIKDA